MKPGTRAFCEGSQPGQSCQYVSVSPQGTLCLFSAGACYLQALFYSGGGGGVSCLSQVYRDFLCDILPPFILHIALLALEWNGSSEHGTCCRSDNKFKSISTFHYP